MSNPSPSRTFTVDSLPVRVHATQAGMAGDVARAAQEHLQRTLADRGSAAVILATGNSQIQFLNELISLGGIEWSRVTLFHMDEYLGLPEDHPASFRKYMKERVESRIRPKVFHYIDGNCLEPLDEVDRYTRLLRAQSIDLCCLGVGENGHLAFNDPPVADFGDTQSVKLVKLDEPCRQQQVGEGHFPDLDSVPLYAFTLTIPMLCSAARMLCVAPEKRKAAAVKAMLQGPITTECPASFLRQKSHATLFLDQDSASLL